MKKSPTSTKLIVAAIAFVVVLTGAVGLYVVVHGKNRTISQTAADLEFALAREGQLRSIKQIVGDTKEARAQLSEHFVAPDGTVGFLESIEGLAGDAGVAAEISSVTIEPITPVDPRPITAQQLELLNIAVSAEGSWQEVYHFLSLVESLPFFVDIEEARFRYVETTDLWNSTITVRVAKRK